MCACVQVCVCKCVWLHVYVYTHLDMYSFSNVCEGVYILEYVCGHVDCVQCVNMDTCMLELCIVSVCTCVLCIWAYTHDIVCFAAHVNVCIQGTSVWWYVTRVQVCLKAECTHVNAVLPEGPRATPCLSLCSRAWSRTHMLLIKSLERLQWQLPGAGVSHTRSPMPHSRGACPSRK